MGIWRDQVKSKVEVNEALKVLMYDEIKEKFRLRWSLRGHAFFQTVSSHIETVIHSALQMELTFLET